LTRLPRRRLHPGRNRTKAIIDVVALDGRAVVIKDFAARPWPVRAILGPWHLDREETAYRNLEGVPGIPEYLGRVDRQAIALGFIPGRPLAALAAGDLPPAFFDDLDRLLAAVHARGVAHGDLHRRDVIAGDNGHAHVVDFSTAVCAPPEADPLLAFVFRQTCRADRRAAAKLRRRYLLGPGAPIPARPALYRIGGCVRRIIDRFRR
jgi:tRNA A-37 threonylcarbamoyl transferase component Bud32